MNKPLYRLLSLLILLIPVLAFAGAELDDDLSQAMKLAPDAEAGRKVFKLCSVCHGNESWGTQGGAFPQLAGQHKSVIIKQIADIRAGNRDNPQMLPIARAAVMGGPQAIADVTAYISTLPMNPDPGLGSGENPAKGEKLFFRKCAECHGTNGEGDPAKFYPRIQGQHYEYLLRQLKWIQSGKRRNADPKMMQRVKKMKVEQLELLADYVSRLKPAADKLGPAGWKNPDFLP